MVADGAIAEDSSSGAGVTVPLDSLQLKRIEATHRGFLYQHLYAVGCLLLAPIHGARVVVVEFDEDIEVQFPAGRLYLQVKTRSEPIQPSDLAGIQERFAALRKLHENGERAGSAEFIILCNVPPSPKLAGLLPSWPKDVRLVYPGAAGEPRCPPAWVDLNEAVNWCCARAASVQFTKLEPATMVWKLAAHIAWLCTGTSGNHAVQLTELPELCEQVVVQLQRIPAPPRPYHQQQSEPSLSGGTAIQLIVGIGGSGKTAWVSEQAAHVVQQVVYFNANGTTSLTLAGSIAREVCGAVLSQGKAIGEVLRPGSSGLDALRAIDRHIQAPLIVVVDNVHAVEAEAVADVVACSRSLRWILLSHPSPRIGELVARIGVEASSLGGWSPDVVARVLRDRGCPAGMAVVETAIRVTGGLPLHVLNLATLARDKYSGDVARLCAELNESTHLTRTAQERLLGGVCQALPGECQRSMAVLELSDVPLTSAEVRTLLREVLGSESASSVRMLAEHNIIQDRGTDLLAIHDAFRMNARELRATLTKEELERARSVLGDLLFASLPEGMQADRLRLYLALLAQSGKKEALVDIVSNLSEWIAQLGIQDEVYRTLEAIRADSMAPDDRFWLLDVLAFMDIEQGDIDRAEARVSEMKAIQAGQHGAMSADQRSRGAIALKEILICGGRRDFERARGVFESAVKDGGYDESMLRVLRYDLTAAALNCDEEAFALANANALIHEYLAVMGLELSDVLFRNPPEIARSIGNLEDFGLEAKRLADSFEVASIAAKRLGVPHSSQAINAMKFYALVGAHSSAVRMGQEVVDFLLATGPTGPQAACKFLEETLIPGTAEVKLVEQMFAVRSQYAVVLAWCNRFEDARREIERLEPYYTGLPEKQAAEFDNQRELIRRLESRAAVAQLDVDIEQPRAGQAKAKIGRNDPCPCGSGKKFKKCCI